MAKKRKSLLSNACVMPGYAIFGDSRYRYKAYRCMTPAEKTQHANMYPYGTPGIPDSAYAYPITRDGKPAHARRALLWTYEHTKQRVNKMLVKLDEMMSRGSPQEAAWAERQMKKFKGVK
jgi:hypothetical protein